MRSEEAGRHRTRDCRRTAPASFRPYRTSTNGAAAMIPLPLHGGQRMNHAEDTGDQRSLPVLRALIDAVDHDILQLLSRRNGLVAEVAAYKRQHSVAIRDARREREIIADRRERS